MREGGFQSQQLRSKFSIKIFHHFHMCKTEQMLSKLYMVQSRKLCSTILFLVCNSSMHKEVVAALYTSLLKWPLNSHDIKTDLFEQLAHQVTVTSIPNTGPYHSFFIGCYRENNLKSSLTRATGNSRGPDWSKKLTYQGRSYCGTGTWDKKVAGTGTQTSIK